MMVVVYSNERYSIHNNFSVRYLEKTMLSSLREIQFVSSVFMEFLKKSIFLDYVEVFKDQITAKKAAIVDLSFRILTSKKVNSEVKKKVLAIVEKLYYGLERTGNVILEDTICIAKTPEEVYEIAKIWPIIQIGEKPNRFYFLLKPDEVIINENRFALNV